MQAGQGVPHSGAQITHARLLDLVPQRREPHNRGGPQRLPASRQRDRRPLRHHTDQDGAVDRARALRPQRERGRPGRVPEDPLAQVRSDA